MVFSTHPHTDSMLSQSSHLIGTLPHPAPPLCMKIKLSFRGGELLSIGSLAQEPLLSYLSMHGYYLCVSLRPLADGKWKAYYSEEEWRVGQVWMERDKANNKQKKDGQENRERAACVSKSVTANREKATLSFPLHQMTTEAEKGLISVTNDQSFLLTQGFSNQIQFCSSSGVKTSASLMQIGALHPKGCCSCRPRRWVGHVSRSNYNNWIPVVRRTPACTCPFHLT